MTSMHVVSHTETWKGKQERHQGMRGRIRNPNPHPAHAKHARPTPHAYALKHTHVRQQEYSIPVRAVITLTLRLSLQLWCPWRGAQSKWHCSSLQAPVFVSARSRAGLVSGYLRSPGLIGNAVASGPGRAANCVKHSFPPAPPNCPLRNPKYHQLETTRPLIEVHWGV